MLDDMSSPGEATPHDRRFQPLRAAAFERFAVGDYAAVLPIALRAQALFPQMGEVPFWIACVRARLGDAAAALEALDAGLRRGLYWPRGWLEEDDDLEPLRGRPDFAAVVEASAAASAHAATPSPAELRPVILEAAGRPARAVVLALHGWGQEPREFALHWRAAAEVGFTVAAVRSGQQPTPGFFVWDDRARARADVAAQFAAACGGPQPEGDEAAAGRPLLIAGFSQGAGVAVDLAVDGLPAPAAGFLAVAGGLEDLGETPAAPRLAAAAARGVRGRLLAGEHDEGLEDIRGLAQVLTEAGLTGGLTELCGLVHEMPEPPGAVLAEGLASLLPRAAPIT
jgi:predicted esterase